MGQEKLRNIKKNDLIDLFNQYSRDLMKNPEVNTIEGVTFLSSWLKKNNFIQIIEKNFKTSEYLEHFVGEKKKIKAQPRGIVCHWIAGNVPTLGLFSLFQSIFVGNINILRIPPKSHDIMIKLLNTFSDTTTDCGISGKNILESIGILYFDKQFQRGNIELSEIADARVVWGGEDAVKSITGISKRAHCEDIIFGPKYSFAVFDKEAIASETFQRYLRFLVSDIYLFDQAACTSPHVIFFERGGKDIKDIIMNLRELFEKQSKRFPKLEIDPFIASKIINIRAQYALDLGKDVICPPENDWTILINNDLCLEEPIESRTIFIKELNSIMEVIPLITKKIQTIGCAVENRGKLLEFANEVTYRGVSRCVNIGQMHLYDSPWDGILLMSQLVNWVTLYYGAD
jgi:hypothetical protein